MHVLLLFGHVQSLPIAYIIITTIQDHELKIGQVMPCIALVFGLYGHPHYDDARCQITDNNLCTRDENSAETTVQYA